MLVQPYLNFGGRSEEAIEFYKTALGAEVEMLMRFKDMPRTESCNMTPGVEEKVMHASLRIGDSKVMLSDGQCKGNTSFSGTSLSLTLANDAQAQRAFNALAEGGKVHMPLTRTFFTSSFGMVDDRFGVPWMIVVGH